MELNYIVHSCVEDAVAITVTVKGREVQATVPGLVVEIVGEDGGMSHTLRLTPDDIEAAKELFAVGNAVTSTFTKTA